MPRIRKQTTVAEGQLSLFDFDSLVNQEVDNGRQSTSEWVSRSSGNDSPALDGQRSPSDPGDVGKRHSGGLPQQGSRVHAEASLRADDEHGQELGSNTQRWVSGISSEGRGIQPHSVEDGLRVEPVEPRSLDPSAQIATPLARAQNNLTALEALVKLRSGERSPKLLEALAAYGGWGGSADTFSPYLKETSSYLPIQKIELPTL